MCKVPVGEEARSDGFVGFGVDYEGWFHGESQFPVLIMVSAVPY